LLNNTSLKTIAVKGAFWGMFSNIFVSAVSFLGTAILARMIEPEDFGLVGMSSLIYGVVALFRNLGLGQALIQKKDADQLYWSTAYWANVFVGIFLAIVTVFAAPLFANFFKEPRLVWVVRCCSIEFIIIALYSTHTTVLSKEIKMKLNAKIEVGTRIIRIVVILTCAAFGLKYWSIIIGVLTERVLRAIAFNVFVDWNPKFVFCKKRFSELFKFSKHLYGQNFLNYFNQNMDFIVTGKVLGAQMLGFYQFSYNLPHLVRQYIFDGVTPISYPVFCKVNDDLDVLASGYLRIVKLISIITFPILFGLSFCAKDFIIVVYGQKWLMAIEPLKLLCFSAAIASVHSIVNSLFNSLGRPDIGFKWNLVKLPMTIGFIYLFSRFWGLVGVAFAMFMVEMISVIQVYLAIKLLKTKMSRYYFSLLPATICSILMILVVGLLHYFVLLDPDWYFLRLLFSFVVGAGAYFVFLRQWYRSDLNYLIDTIKHVKK